MNCYEIRKYFSEYIDGELAPELSIRVKRHIKTCSECGEEFSVFKKTVKAVRGFDTLPPPPDMIVNVNRMIDADTFLKRLYRSFSDLFVLGTPVKAVAVTIIAILVIYLSYMQPMSLRSLKKAALERHYKGLNAEKDDVREVAKAGGVAGDIEMERIEEDIVGVKKPKHKARLSEPAATPPKISPRKTSPREESKPAKAQADTSKVKDLKKRAAAAPEGAEVKERTDSDGFYIPTMFDPALRESGVSDEAKGVTPAEPYEKLVWRDDSAISVPEGSSAGIGDDREERVKQEPSDTAAAARVMLQEKLPESQLSFSALSEDDTVDHADETLESGALRGKAQLSSTDRRIREDIAALLSGKPALKKKPAPKATAVGQVKSKKRDINEDYYGDFEYNGDYMDSIESVKKNLKSAARTESVSRAMPEMEGAGEDTVGGKRSRKRIVSESKKAERVTVVREPAASKGYNYFRFKVKRLKYGMDFITAVAEENRVKIANRDRLEVTRGVKRLRMILLIPASTRGAFFKSVLANKALETVNKGIVDLHLTREMRGKIELMLQRSPEEFFVVEIELTM